MSLEILDKLEQKIRELINSEENLRNQLNQLKVSNAKLIEEKEYLALEKQELFEEQEKWKEKVASLLSKFETH